RGAPVGRRSGDAAPRVDRPAPRVHRADHEPRGVVAPDPLEPVLDLAAELAVDDHHEVEDARGYERVLVVVALDQQMAERGLDLARGGVALAPDLLGHVTARATCAERSARPPVAARASRRRTRPWPAGRPATP